MHYRVRGWGGAFAGNGCCGDATAGDWYSARIGHAGWYGFLVVDCANAGRGSGGHGVDWWREECRLVGGADFGCW